MDTLRSIIESALGEVLSLEQEAPGVYFTVSLKSPESFSEEHYLVEQGSEIISDQAKSYGVPVPGHPELLLYPLDEPDSGYQIIRYEVAMHRHRVAPMPETLADVRALASFGAEDHPAYFGEYPAPLDTPRGRMLRSRRIWNGIWCLETDQGERMVAFCYPLWKCVLSPWTTEYGETTREDAAHGIDSICGYLFFPWEASCIPLYEWIGGNPERKALEMIDYAALQNVICNRYTDYALRVNDYAQSRKTAFAAEGMEPPETPDRSLACIPDAGFDFLKF